MINNKNHQLSNGFIRYFQEDDAQRAILQSDLAFNARYAYEKKIKRGFGTLITHDLCQVSVMSHVYELHKDTCTKLRTI